jgi:hypothetical protein
MDRVVVAVAVVLVPAIFNISEPPEGREEAPRSTAMWSATEVQAVKHYPAMVYAKAATTIILTVPRVLLQVGIPTQQEEGLMAGLVALEMPAACTTVVPAEAAARP